MRLDFEEHFGHELTDDYGNPKPTIPNSNQEAHAKVALALRDCAPSLSTEQLEHCIVWLKKVKDDNLGSFYYGREYPDIYYQKLQDLKNSPEQTQLQKKATRKALKSNAAAIGCFFFATISLLLYFLDVSKWWQVVPGCIVLILWDLMQKATRESLEIAKEQDRKHLMASFRAANNINDLNEAGFFMHLPSHSMPGDDAFNALRRSASRQINRFRDVLYTEHPYGS